MKGILSKLTMLIIISLVIAQDVYAQCQQYAEKCLPLLEPFRSDGQFHRALLREGETAEFVATFYKGNTYRIASCTCPNNDTLIYKVLDSNYQLIYTNEDYNYEQYWDFKFNATDKYYIQSELVEGAGSGCAVVLIGFKE